MKESGNAGRARQLVVGLVVCAAVVAGVAGDAHAQYAVVYKDSRQRGATLPVSGDIPRLSAYSFNDDISSIRLTGGLPIAVYKDADYGGACFTVGGDVSSMSDAGFGNDNISSIRVAWTCAGGRVEADACKAAPCTRDQVCTDVPFPALGNAAGRTCSADVRPNLARNASARQSSTIWGGAASRAIDGVGSGNFNLGSVTHTDNPVGGSWLELDLGAPTAIGTIVVYNRTDAAPERLTGTRLELSPVPCDNPALQTIASATPLDASAVQTRDLAEGPVARYFCVRSAGRQYLSVAEVQVMAAAPRAAVSEVGANPLPCEATVELRSWKGDLLTRSDGAVAVTTVDAPGAAATWRVICRPEATWLRSTRGDLLTRSLASIGATRELGMGNDWTIEGLGDDRVRLRSIDRLLNRADTPGVTAGAEGTASVWRFRVVEPPPVAGAVNIARFAHVRQSSTSNGAPPGRAVDGDTTTAWAGGSVTATIEAASQWLEVALGAGTDVQAVVVYNRSDCCADRLNGAVVELRAAPCDLVAAGPTASLIVASRPIPLAGATVGARTVIPFPAGTKASFLCIRQPRKTILSVAEVEVHGVPPTPDTVEPPSECGNVPMEPKPAGAGGDALVADRRQLSPVGATLRVCFLKGLNPTHEITCGADRPDGVYQQLAAFGEWVVETADDPSAKEDFETIAQYARVWERYANVHFQFLGRCEAGVEAELVVSTEKDLHVGGQYRPAVARPCSAGQACPPNLIINERSSRVILHELGHALGLQHEQKNPRIAWNWVQEEIEDDGGDWSQWQPYDATEAAKHIVATDFDPYSIMLYRIPYKYLVGGKDAWRKMYPLYPLDRCEARDLSPMDKATIARLYPFSGPRDVSFGYLPGRLLSVLHQGGHLYGNVSGWEVGEAAAVTEYPQTFGSDDLVVFANDGGAPWLVAASGEVSALPRTVAPTPTPPATRVGTLPPLPRKVVRTQGNRVLILTADGTLMSSRLQAGAFTPPVSITPVTEPPLRSFCVNDTVDDHLYGLDLAGTIVEYRREGDGPLIRVGLGGNIPVLGALEIACDARSIYLLGWDGRVTYYYYGWGQMTVWNPKGDVVSAQFKGTRNLIRIGNSVMAINDPQRVALHQHRDFGGKALEATVDYSRLSDVGFNDRLSSVQLAGQRALVSFYEHKSFGGECRSYTVSAPSIEGSGWRDNVASSLKLGTPCRYSLEGRRIYHEVVQGRCPLGGIPEGARCRLLDLPGTAVWSPAWGDVRQLSTPKVGDACPDGGLADGAVCRLTLP